MRIVFYAPLKSPYHPTPSGDRQMARLLIGALNSIGHEVNVVSEFRSYDRSANGSKQEKICQAAELEAILLEEHFSSLHPNQRPELWLTYHVYYRAPDWLGPRLSQKLGIPYVIAEASLASKRASTPWIIGHEATQKAITIADAIICLTRHDLQSLRNQNICGDHVHYLPPFIDTAPFTETRKQRVKARRTLNEKFRCSLNKPWLLSVGMLRYGDKLASYQLLASALRKMLDEDWQHLIVGDGEARTSVEEAFSEFPDQRIIFLGKLPQEDLALIYAACDIYVWPAVNEAYGLSFLEAQAAGLPIVSARVRGVPDVVQDHESGLLSPEGDIEGFANLMLQLLKDKKRRESMGNQGAHFVHTERGIRNAAQGLHRILSTVRAFSRKPQP